MEELTFSRDLRFCCTSTSYQLDSRRKSVTQEVEGSSEGYSAPNTRRAGRKKRKKKTTRPIPSHLLIRPGKARAESEEHYI